MGLVISVVAGGWILWLVDKQTLITLNVNVFRYEIVALLILLLAYRFRAKLADLLQLDAGLRHWRAILFAPFALAGKAKGDDPRMLMIASALACAYIVFAWCAIQYAVHTVNFVSYRYMDKLRQGMLAQAVKADKTGNYNAALVKYRAVLSQFPDDIRNNIISARIESIRIQSAYGGRRLAALDVKASNPRSAAYLDALISVCSINSNALPCASHLRQHRDRVEGALARLADDRRSCFVAAKRLDPALLIDERDRIWLEIGPDDAEALCAFAGASNSADLRRYLEHRWRLAELRRWLEADDAMAG